MTQTILAMILAGFLAFSPTTETPDKRTQDLRANRRAVRRDASSVAPVGSRRVLILDQPLEPRYTYIRVDNAVYALSLRTSETMG